MATFKITMVTGTLSHAGGGPCLDQLRVMTLNANSLFTVPPWPEYKYCKIVKAASKLRLDTLMVHGPRVNGRVGWHVQDVQIGATQYGYCVIWLHTKTYVKGGLMLLLRDDSDSHGPLTLTPPLDEQVLRVGLQLPIGERVILLNVHAPNPAANRKMFWEELVGVAKEAACLVPPPPLQFPPT